MSMEKSYYDFMSVITPKELYKRLMCYGLFSEKLPPIFDLTDYFKYCGNAEASFFADKKI